jgi:hypothetical protein
MRANFSLVFVELDEAPKQGQAAQFSATKF